MSPDDKSPIPGLNRLLGKKRQNKASMNAGEEKDVRRPPSNGRAGPKKRGAAKGATVLSTPTEQKAATVINKSSVLTSGTTEKGFQDFTYRVYENGDLIEDRYLVEKRYEGGMGYVYIATDSNEDITFAIKQPKEEMLAESDFFVRVQKEANAWTKLGMHPHIAYCYFVKQIGGAPFIFVEYAESGSLQDWIENGKCVENKLNLDLAIQFCHGMERAHERGMIHRDIKPDNILITGDGRVKVTDFGLVGGEVVRGRASGLQTTVHGRTMIGAQMGTPDFMSPEQWADPRQKSEDVPDGVWFDSDIFSFGICLWEMFCGNKPYPDYTRIITREARPPDPRKFVPDMDDDLRYVLLKSVQIDRAKRYQDFRQLRMALNKAYKAHFGEDAPSFQIEVPDTSADELNNQGYSYYELGQVNEALTCFKSAFERDPTHPQVVFNASLLEWRSGKVDDLSVLERLKNCAGNTTIDKKMLARLMAEIHLERMDAESAQKMLKARPDIFEKICGASKPSRVRQLHILNRHLNAVKSVSLDSDGRRGLSGGWDKMLMLWDMESGECLHTMSGHTDVIKSVSLSADGRRGLSGSDDKTLRLWDLESGECLRTLEGRSGGITSVCLSANSRRGLSGSDDNRLKLWDMESGECLRTMDGHADGITTVSLSAKGRYGLSGSDDKTLKLWDLKSGQCLLTLEGHSGGITSVCLSADSRRGLSGSDDKTLKLWNLKTGECLRTLEGHTGWVSAVSLSGDGATGLSGGWDKTLRLWDMESGQCLRTLAGHKGEVTSVALSVDGSRALAGNEDNSIKFYDLPKKHRKAFKASISLGKTAGYTTKLKESRKINLKLEQAQSNLKIKNYKSAWEALLFVWRNIDFGDSSPVLKLYSRLQKIGSLKGLVFSGMFKTVKQHTKPVNAISINADGQRGLSGSDDKTLKLWNTRKGKCLFTLVGHTGSVTSASLSADGLIGLSGSKDKMLKHWDLESGKCLRTLEGHKEPVTSVSLSANGNRGLSGSEDRTLKLWDLETGQCLQALSGHKNWVSSVALSRDGKFGLSGSYDSTLKLWDMKTGQCLRTFEGHTNRIFSVALSADGGLGLSGSADNTLKLWDMKTGECLRTLVGHENRIMSVTMSADGCLGVSGSWDHTLKLWNLENGDCLRTVEVTGSAGVTAVGLSGDGRIGISGYVEGAITIWKFIWDLDFPLGSVRCPHCDKEIDEGVDECPFCGVIIKNKTGPLETTEEDYAEEDKEYEEDQFSAEGEEDTSIAAADLISPGNIVASGTSLFAAVIGFLRFIPPKLRPLLISVTAFFVVGLALFGSNVRGPGASSTRPATQVLIKGATSGGCREFYIALLEMSQSVNSEMEKGGLRSMNRVFRQYYDAINNAKCKRNCTKSSQSLSSAWNYIRGASVALHDFYSRKEESDLEKFRFNWLRSQEDLAVLNEQLFNSEFPVEDYLSLYEN